MYNNSANTKFTGKSLLFLPSCHSTNLVASEKLRAGEAINGLIVITDDQTSGKGQRGNSWLTEPGANLTLSIIYTPEKLPVEHLFYLNIVSSLAVADTLANFMPSAQIRVKWPNDIYCGEKKICGILVENSIRNQSVSSIILGIGINVNQQHFSIPSATSMRTETGELFKLNTILQSLAENIEQYYLLLLNYETENLLEAYQKRLFQRGQHCRYKDAQGMFTGSITGVADTGQLLVEKDTGVIQAYDFKEIEYLIQ